MLSPHNPGSDEAIDAGCTCPVMDNSHGNDYMGMEGIFVMSGGCPLHGMPIKEDESTIKTIQNPK
jgi:hypothetical protein